MNQNGIILAMIHGIKNGDNKMNPYNILLPPQQQTGNIIALGIKILDDGKYKLVIETGGGFEERAYDNLDELWAYVIPAVKDFFNNSAPVLDGALTPEEVAKIDKGEKV